MQTQVPTPSPAPQIVDVATTSARDLIEENVAKALAVVLLIQRDPDVPRETSDAAWAAAGFLWEAQDAIASRNGERRTQWVRS